MEFAIVDIETTGGHPSKAGITEVAVFVTNGRSILDSYHTLLNPGQRIPSFITGLTGIDNLMVSEAPFFQDIADELYSFLEGRTFVAHHVNFDYGFLKQAFADADRKLDLSRLCTVRLGRKLIPGLRSYGLGNLCAHLGINNDARHRAHGDAAATTEVFHRFFEIDPEFISQNSKKKDHFTFLPPNISSELFRKLPESTGVYYFHDAKGKVIYVGKALNIKERFKGHFSRSIQEEEKLKLHAEVHDVSWELTGNEFLAFLIELQEIKRLWPKFNKAQKFKGTAWALYHYQDGLGQIRFQVGKSKPGIKALALFEQHSEAWSFLKSAVQSHQLCPRLCGLQKTMHQCYAQKDESCQGVCNAGEQIHAYNQRANQLLERLEKLPQTILIKEKGRTKNESAAILFEEGIFKAYGYLPNEMELGTDVRDCLTKINALPESRYILRRFLPSIPLTNIQVL